MEAAERAVERLNADADLLRDEHYMADAIAVQKAVDALERARRAVEVGEGEEAVADLISTASVASRTFRRIFELLGDNTKRRVVRDELSSSLRAMFADTLPIHVETLQDFTDPDEKP